MAFQTVLKKARFKVPGYSPEQMAAIADKTVVSVRERIRSGNTVQDSPAPALRPGYAKFKARKAPPAIRNWQMSGRTLRSMKTLTAGHNTAKIGFTDSVTNMRAYINNARYRQFGVSPNDRRVLNGAVGQVLPVKIETSRG